MTNTYDIGDVVRVTATFTDSDGTPVDPDSVSIKYRDPSGNVTTESSPTKSETGVYYTDVTPDRAGRWRWRATGTGSNAVAEEGEFLVRERTVF